MIDETNGALLIEGPQALATQILTECVHEMTATSSVDVVVQLRRLQRVCEVLGWSDSAVWFRNELNGFSETAPNHRFVTVDIGWAPRGFSPSSASLGILDSMLFQDVRQERLGMRHGFPQLIEFRNAGFAWATGNVRSKKADAFGKPTSSEQLEWVVIRPPAVASIISSVEQMAFDFAVSTEAKLRFGNVASDVFQSYRLEVDAALKSLGVGNSLAAALHALQHQSQESAKMAILACRNVLLDLSGSLWRVPELHTHPTLTNHKGAPLQLDARNVKARLRAFLYEKGVALTARGSDPLLFGQADRLADTVDQLYNLASEQGKNRATREDALSIVLHTYMLLGEITRTVGLSPVTQLSDVHPSGVSLTSD